LQRQRPWKCTVCDPRRRIAIAEQLTTSILRQYADDVLTAGALHLAKEQGFSAESADLQIEGISLSAPRSDTVMITVQSLLVDHLQYTYEKEAWHPPLGMAVRGLTAAQAAWKPSPERHSIWQIVRHVLHWKRGVLDSLDGNPPDYDALTNADWPEAAGDQAAWDADVAALGEVSAAFRQRLDVLGEGGLQQAQRAYQQSPQPTVAARRLLWVFTHDAYHAGQIQYLRALQEIPADRFFTAATTGDAGRLAELLDADPGLLNAHSREGWTALQLAAYFGHRSAVEHLLARGATVQTTSDNEMANTALHGAIAGKRTEIVSVLLDHGADPEAADSQGNTALHLAAHEGVFEIVELLLRRGVNLHARRGDGLTPLEVAAKESPAAADLLRTAGATA
jgi:uncharacterized damage-inducible protein DinB